MNISTERFGTFTLDEINDKLRVTGKVLVLKIEKSDRSLVDAYVTRDVPPYEPETQTFEGRRLSTTPKDGYYRSVKLVPDQGGPASEYWMEPESMYAERVTAPSVPLALRYSGDSANPFGKRRDVVSQAVARAEFAEYGWVCPEGTIAEYNAPGPLPGKYR